MNPGDDSGMEMEPDGWPVWLCWVYAVCIVGIIAAMFLSAVVNG